VRRVLRQERIRGDFHRRERGEKGRKKTRRYRQVKGKEERSSSSDSTPGVEGRKKRLSSTNSKEERTGEERDISSKKAVEREEGGGCEFSREGGERTRCAALVVEKESGTRRLSLAPSEGNRKEERCFHTGKERKKEKEREEHLREGESGLLCVGRK